MDAPEPAPDNETLAAAQREVERTWNQLQQLRPLIVRDLCDPVLLAAAQTAYLRAEMRVLALTTRRAPSWAETDLARARLTFIKWLIGTGRLTEWPIPPGPRKRAAEP